MYDCICVCVCAYVHVSVCMHVLAAGTETLVCVASCNVTFLVGLWSSPLSLNVVKSHSAVV